MILYQKKTVAGQPVGAPAELPFDLVGLSDETLAELSWTDPALGYHGFKFEPVEVTDPNAPPRRIGRLPFMQRIPPPARIAIRSAGKVDVIVEDFLDLLAASDVIELDHPDTQMGVGYLVQQGLLTEQEAADLLG